MSKCFFSPSLVSVLCSSRGAEFTMKGFTLRCNLICQGEFTLCCYNLLFSLLFIPLYLSPRLGFLLVSLMQSCPLALFISSCLAAAPSKTQRPFSNVVPLSPLSLSLLPKLAGSSAALSCFFLVSHLLILQCASVCVCVSVCVQKKPKIRGPSYM